MAGKYDYLSEDLMKSVQTRLKELGYYMGMLDGVPGVMTSQALTNFKADVGYAARDYPGPLTMASLFDPEAKPRSYYYPDKPSKPPSLSTELTPPGSPLPVQKLPWMEEAKRLLGVKEIAGSKNNPVIMQWAIDLDQWYPGDDTAWCGLFVAHCMAYGAPEEPQNFNRLGAREWLNYGVDAGGPMYGSICVLWRTHPTNSWHGHVFLVTGMSDDAVRGIGGNQQDQVSELWFSKSRVLGYRRPTTALLKLAPMAKTGQLSTKES